MKKFTCDIENTLGAPCSAHSHKHIGMVDAGCVSGFVSMGRQSVYRFAGWGFKPDSPGVIGQHTYLYSNVNKRRPSLNWITMASQ